MSGRNRRGMILYLGDTVGERGREWFQRTDRTDGTSVIRTVSDIRDTGLLRDVTYAFDSQYRPLDCYERLIVRGETNMGWFHFSDDEITCEGMYADLGRVSQRVKVRERAPFFGAHPVCGDALVCGAYDLAKGGRQEVHGYLSSPLTTGASGPMIYPFPVAFEDHGAETIEVPAGRFDTRHIRTFYGPGFNLSQDAWVMADYTFCKLRNDELGSSYVLAEYSEM